MFSAVGKCSLSIGRLPLDKAAMAGWGLHSNMKFHGEQKSKNGPYPVDVTIQNVDMKQGYLCGYLSIQGITEEMPTLSTFFDGEIIGPECTFLTRKWDASEDVDRQHWSKFRMFKEKKFDKTFNNDDFDYKNEIDYNECVFMRWKEHFLVQDHTVTSVRGASFAGFYYLCYMPAEQKIEGYYFHKDSEWFQSLSLKQVVEPFSEVHQFR